MHTPTAMGLVAEIVDKVAPEAAARLVVALAIAPPKMSIAEILRQLDTPDGLEKVRVIRRAFDLSKKDGTKAAYNLLCATIKERREDKNGPL